jgi:hypothetical protein
MYLRQGESEKEKKQKRVLDRASATDDEHELVRIGQRIGAEENIALGLVSFGVNRQPHLSTVMEAKGATYMLHAKYMVGERRSQTGRVTSCNE